MAAVFDFLRTTQSLACSHHDEQQVREALWAAKRAGAHEAHEEVQSVLQRAIRTLAVAEWTLEAKGDLDLFERKTKELDQDNGMTFIGRMKCLEAGCWRPSAYDGRCEIHG